MAIAQNQHDYIPSTQDTCNWCDLAVFLVYFVNFYCLNVLLLPFPLLSYSTVQSKLTQLSYV